MTYRCRTDADVGSERGIIVTELAELAEAAELAGAAELMTSPAGAGRLPLVYIVSEVPYVVGGQVEVSIISSP